MAPKQGSLGFEKSNQTTLGKFFGQPNGTKPKSAPPQQSKLSFATKPGSKASPVPIDSSDHEEDMKPTKAQKGKKDSKIACPEDDVDSSQDGKRKRPRATPDSKGAVEGPAAKSKPSIDAEDQEPVAKRARKSRKIIEDEEDGDEDFPDVFFVKEKHKKETKKAASAVDKKEPRSSKKSEEETPQKASEDEEEDEVEKAETPAKVRKVVQTTLKSKTKHPYPDWNPGEPVPYAALCTTFSLVELTSKRLEITEHCALFLRQVIRLTPEDLLPTVLLMVNKLAPDYAGIELGIGESLIMKAIGEATGRTLAIIKQDQQQIGDLGLVAIKSRSKQPTMFKPKPLTVPGVLKGLMGIATTTGSGAQGRKVDGIKKLLSAADSNSTKKADIEEDKGGPSETKFLVRFLEGKLRLGLAEKTVLVSLAQAVVCHEAEKKDRAPSTADMEKAESTLKTVYSELPSYDVIIPAMLEHGIMKLGEHCKLRPGVPLKPMLANPTKSITEVLDRFEGKYFTCEFKYDGERAQIHYVSKKTGEDLGRSFPGAAQTGDGVAAIFSRNSEDLSKKYPDILAKLATWVKDDTTSFVLDCETVAWDVVEKKVLPFQQLMTRKKKDVKIQDVKVKVCVFAFDLLYINGEAIVEKSLRERRELLKASFAPVEGEFAFASSMDSRELEDIQTFLDESIKASCEGLMVKMLDGPESGYEPSKRSRNWLKVKKDYLAGVGDSLDLVVLGAYYGKGKRTSWYGSFLLACYNPKTETYETLCNVGTGFSEAILEELHKMLSAEVIDRPKPFYVHSSVAQAQPNVWFEPRYVWEVKTADLTLSPRYKAGVGEGVDPAGEKGISLRFPRFIKTRDDKKPDEATSSRQVADMYRKQESVTKKKGPSVDDDFEY